MQITIREPGSAITHFIGMMMAVLAAMPLLAKAGMSGSIVAVEAMMVFMSSMVLLYGASALYHSVMVSERLLRVFKKLDHMMIFVLIAGSYTPVCLLVLDEETGHRLLVVIWGIAAAGIVVKALWIYCPKWFSSIIYISMGWVCIFVFGQLFQTLSMGAFLWLLSGGLIYTAGGIIYALKLPLFRMRHGGFGIHEVFHLFVMAGSVCHFIFMYRYVI